MSDIEVRFHLMLFALFSTLFGACVGSFLNVCIHRIPRDESVIKPRSHCPHCQTTIPWYLNIPILSWLALRGRCATCQGRIAFRYTLVELLTAMLFLAAFIKWAAPAALALPPTPHALIVPIHWLFLASMVLGTFVDFEHFIIPDSVTIGGMVLGPLVSALAPQLHGRESWYAGLSHSLVGLLVGFGLLYGVAWLGAIIFKKEAMGFGDVKLMGAIGAFLGWPAVCFTIFASSLLGSVCGVTMIAIGGAKMGSRIPFGPYLALAATIWLFWGPAILHLYLAVMRG